MTIRYKTTGFVFKKDEISEADQIFSVFTKDFGRVGLKAKAIRKITSKLRSGIDIFYLCEIEFIQGKNFKTLTNAGKIKKFDEVILNPQKLVVAYQIAEALEVFLKGQEKDEAIFNLISEIFENLKGSIKNEQLVFQYFFWNFISLQGYHLQTENYSCCHAKLNQNDLCFSGKEGGIICKNCTASNVPQNAKQKINSDVIKILRLILKKDWQTISKLKVEPHSQKLLEEISQNATHAFCPG